MSAFRACYADGSTVQIILEVPIEQADEAYQVLGGMPNPGSETWVGVARINPEHTRVEEPPAASSDARESVQCQPAPDVGRPARAKRKLEEMPPSSQAGILCNEPAFQRFMMDALHINYMSPEEAAGAVRRLCNVTSLSDIDANNESWKRLAEQYRAWIHDPVL